MMRKSKTVRKCCAVGFDSAWNRLAVFISDNGTTWHEAVKLEKKYNDYNANDVFILDKNNIFIVGDIKGKKGFLLRSTDGGVSWRSKEFGPPLNHIDIKGEYIWICGNNGSVWLGTGIKNTRWKLTEQKNMPDIPQDIILQGIGCVSEKEVYTVGHSKNGYSAVWKTVDGGKDWNIVTFPPPKDKKAELIYIGVVVVNKDLIYIHGKTKLILKWDGKSWSYLQQPKFGSGFDVNDLFVINENDIWLANDWSISRYVKGNITPIDCPCQGNLMTGIRVVNQSVWACGTMGSSPTPGLLTSSAESGKQCSWQTQGLRQFWKVDVYAE